MPRKIEISYKTIVFTVIFLLFLWFLHLVTDIILELFVALLIMTTLQPLVAYLARFGIPKGISILIVYAFSIGVTAFAVVSIVPALIDQTTSLISVLPEYLKSLGMPQFIIDEFSTQIIAQAVSIPTELVKLAYAIVSNVLTILAVLIFAYYLLIAKDKFDGYLAQFLDEEKRSRFINVLNQLETRLGGWARGEIILMFIVGLANYIGFRLIGIPYALPMAILAGILEVVPYAGPFMAAIPPIIIGFSISPLTGLAAFSWTFLVQQVENYLLVPKVMEKSVGVDPIIILLSLSIGFKLAGVGGAVIAVPLVITLHILIKEYLQGR